MPEEPAPITQAVGRTMRPPYPKVTPASPFPHSEHRGAERDAAGRGRGERRARADAVERQPQQRRAGAARELERGDDGRRSRAVARDGLDRHGVDPGPYEGAKAASTENAA